MIGDSKSLKRRFFYKPILTKSRRCSMFISIRKPKVRGSMADQTELFTKAGTLRRFLDILEARIDFYGEVEVVLPQNRIEALPPGTDEKIPLVWEPGALHPHIRRDRAIKGIVEEWLNELTQQADIPARFMKPRSASPGVNLQWLPSNTFWLTAPEHGDPDLNRLEIEAEVSLMQSILDDESIGNLSEHVKNYPWFFVPLDEVELKKGTKLTLLSDTDQG